MDAATAALIQGVLHAKGIVMLDLMGGAPEHPLFHLDALEDACEDHGQAMVYRGTISGHPHIFRVDEQHRLETEQMFPECGDTNRMLAETSFAPHLNIIGDFGRHFRPILGCG